MKKIFRSFWVILSLMASAIASFPDSLQSPDGLHSRFRGNQVNFRQLIPQDKATINDPRQSQNLENEREQEENKLQIIFAHSVATLFYAYCFVNNPQNQWDLSFQIPLLLTSSLLGFLLRNLDTNSWRKCLLPNK